MPMMTEVFLLSMGLTSPMMTEVFLLSQAITLPMMTEVFLLSMIEFAQGITMLMMNVNVFAVTGYNLADDD